MERALNAMDVRTVEGFEAVKAWQNYEGVDIGDRARDAMACICGDAEGLCVSWCAAREAAGFDMYMGEGDVTERGLFLILSITGNRPGVSRRVEALADVIGRQREWPEKGLWLLVEGMIERGLLGVVVGRECGEHQAKVDRRLRCCRQKPLAVTVLKSWDGVIAAGAVAK